MNYFSELFSKKIICRSILLKVKNTYPFQMSITLSIFLLFYSVCGQELGNDLEAVFRLEDELEARPFLLESGEKYRDLLTITAARNVGEFGIIRSHSQPGQTTVKQARCAEN